jgi:hypothetical protein
MEDQIAESEHEIQTLNIQAEDRLSELDPDQRNQYIALQDENMALEDEITQKRQMLENINQKMLQADS